MRDAGGRASAAAAPPGHTGRMAGGFRPRPGPVPASCLLSPPWRGCWGCSCCSLPRRRPCEVGEQKLYEPAAPTFQSCRRPQALQWVLQASGRTIRPRGVRPFFRPPPALFRNWRVSQWRMQPTECIEDRRASPPQARSARAARPAPTRSGRRRRCGWGSRAAGVHGAGLVALAVAKYAVAGPTERSRRSITYVAVYRAAAFCRLHTAPAHHGRWVRTLQAGF